MGYYNKMRLNADSYKKTGIFYDINETIEIEGDYYIKIKDGYLYNTSISLRGKSLLEDLDMFVFVYNNIDRFIEYAKSKTKSYKNSAVCIFIQGNNFRFNEMNLDEYNIRELGSLSKSKIM